MDNRNRSVCVVDENDRIVGAAKAYKAHHKDSLVLHRAFSLFIFNSDGHLLMQKRSDKKLVFPSMWANSVCSHPFLNNLSFTDPLLDIKMHAARRADYELGIGSLGAEDLSFKGRVLYKAARGKSWGRLLPGDPASQEIVAFPEPENLDRGFTSSDFDEYEVDYTLFARSDDGCSPNPDEVAEVMYVDEYMFEHMLTSESTSPWLKAIARYVDVFGVIKGLLA
jgi:isopentenyl-diphosphate Delta-isomerase